MTLIRRNYPLLSNISDLFDDDWFSNKMTNQQMPAVNVIENADSYEIELAAPGFEKKDFEVVLDNGILEISAKSEYEDKREEKNYTRREFSTRTFSKAFTLPKDVKEDDIDAKYVDGILRLMLKKQEKAVPKKKAVRIL